MKHPPWICFASASVALLLTTVVARAADPLQLISTIELPGVMGRIDHLAVDTKTNRLFVAALASNALEIVDLATGKVTQHSSGLNEPQGIAFLPDLNAVAVANGGDGTCRFFSAETLKLIGSLDYQSDADNLRYDLSKQRLYVGYGSGAIGVLDAASRSKLFDVKLAGHPESFQLEQNGPRLFVNVPSTGHISVIDRDPKKVTATWPVENARANFPMALDEDRHRLFIGCRQPAVVLVYNTDSGKPVARVSTVGDTDDLFYDSNKKQLYVCGGEGFLAAYRQESPDQYSEVARIPTAAGARTALFVPAFAHLYVAVPRNADRSAQIRVYKTN